MKEKGQHKHIGGYLSLSNYLFENFIEECWQEQAEYDINNDWYRENTGAGGATFCAFFFASFMPNNGSSNNERCDDSDKDRGGNHYKAPKPTDSTIIAGAGFSGKN